LFVFSAFSVVLELFFGNLTSNVEYSITWHIIGLSNCGPLSKAFSRVFSLFLQNAWKMLKKFLGFNPNPPELCPGPQWDFTVTPYRKLP